MHEYCSLTNLLTVSIQTADGQSVGMRGTVKCSVAAGRRGEEVGGGVRCPAAVESSVCLRLLL